MAQTTESTDKKTESKGKAVAFHPSQRLINFIAPTGMQTCAVVLLHFLALNSLKPLSFSDSAVFSLFLGFLSDPLIVVDRLQCGMSSLLWLRHPKLSTLAKAFLVGVHLTL